MLACIFDTETTGILDYRAPITADHQPDVVQLCAWLADKERVYTKINILVHADTEIPEGAYEVHRIDRELTKKVGVSRLRACQIMHSFAQKADLLVGHNVEFDIKMMKIAMHREGGGGKSMNKPSFCTMKTSTEICKISNPNRPGSYKWPNLTEAYKKLVDPRGFENAHDAEADVMAAYELFKVLYK